MVLQISGPEGVVWQASQILTPYLPPNCPLAITQPRTDNYQCLCLWDVQTPQGHFCHPAPLIEAKSKTMPQDIATPADIRTLVDRFYDKVNADALLGPVFNDIIRVSWPHHLPVMYRFWGSMLLDEHSYRGQPFLKHVNLPVAPEHFGRWLQLFEQTVNENFAGPKADEALQKATNIATIFQTKMFGSPSMRVTYTPPAG